VLIDVGKGALAAALGFWAPMLSGIDPLLQALSCGTLCAIGHVWPVFFGFRGGKGAAVVIGMLAVCLPSALLPILSVWLLCLLLTGYVGLSTVLAAVALVPVAWWLWRGPGQALVVGFCIALAALLVFTHRSNLRRLAAGTENRFERARVLGRLFERRSRRGA
jgi:glycerol-3-phosphate acyltransferase PlsY